MTTQLNQRYWPIIDQAAIKPRPLELALLLGLLLAGYWQVIPGYFQSEDFPIIQNLYDGTGGLNWGIVLEHFRSHQHIGNFRPLVTLFHMITVSMFGPDPFALRALNMLAHFLSAILIYLLVARIAPTPTPTRLLPFFVSALFIAHPIHPEAVSYLVAVAGAACLSFYLWSLLLFLQFIGRRKPALMGASLVVFGAALGMKEEAVSLPFIVGLLALWHIRFPISGPKVRWIISVVTPYFVVLGLYFGYRLLIFGSMIPAFHEQLEHGLPEFFSGLPVYLYYLLAPINQSVIGSLGPTVATGTMIITLLFALILLVRNRPSFWGSLFCVFAFLAFLVPYYKLVPYGIYPNLLNSRYLYFPSIAAVGLLGWIAFGGRRNRVQSSDHIDKLSLMMVSVLLLVQVALLNVNNYAWSKATRISAFMRDQAMFLTGNDPNVEIVNLPDSIYGAFYDRGSYYRAFFYPFTEQNLIHSRTRTLRVTNTGSTPIASNGVFPDSALSPAGEVAHLILPGGTAEIRVNFTPKEEKRYGGRIQISSPECESVHALVPMYGHGVASKPYRTHLAASISEPLVSHSTQSESRLISVSDLKDGVNAVAVGVSIPDDAGWRLNYWSLNAENQWERLNQPVTIEDGEHRSFRIELIPKGPITPILIAPVIRGLNTLSSANSPNILIGGIAPNELKPDTIKTVEGRNRRSSSGRELLYHCGSVQISTDAVDFGYVPIEPIGPRAHKRIIFFGQAPVQLFWDGQTEQLVPAETLAMAPVVLNLLDTIDDAWIGRFDAEILQTKPLVIRSVAGEYPKKLFFEGLEMSTANTAYFLFEIKLSLAPDPFVHLAWMGETDTHYTSAASVSLPAVPDGEWRTYAIPLHESANWSQTPRVKSLRFIAGADKARVEIARLQIIGPLPPSPFAAHALLY